MDAQSSRLTTAVSAFRDSYVNTFILDWMDLTGDEIAEAVQHQFAQLPGKRKPQIRGNGVKEWVPLSGIVAQVGSDDLKCVALGTGMKCLPQDKLSQARGMALHDSHAEIAAMRAFNRFLLEECRALLLSQTEISQYVRRRDETETNECHFQTFALKDDVKLHMYCSEAPCGDASMELTMAAQADDTPWARPSSISDLEQSVQHVGDGKLHGRGYFSELGIVRRKPGRPDAPISMSKSCSDKISLKQCTSLLSSLSSMFIFPANVYLHSLTLPKSQYSLIACERAFGTSGRMAPIRDEVWRGGYTFHPFEIKITDSEFLFSRRSTTSSKLVASNITAAWTPYDDETIIGGVLQGRKLLDPRGASMLCKVKMWEVAFAIASDLKSLSIQQSLSKESYEQFKESVALQDRRSVKKAVQLKALSGWVRNWGEDFALNDPV